MNKKGDFGWEEISKIFLVLLGLVIVIAIIFLLKEKGKELIENIISVFKKG